ncbi:hypothetical protein J437_LFUL002808 [Ladona fulva]|uniref:Uncharacterized protein n=1 Tax=Ladona fulva TaxID=123851 RepID=A0A8K0P1Z5_LADFU|nr:hypothetical protein J437_LFUL002808 [Ladona fulva]
MALRKRLSLMRETSNFSIKDGKAAPQVKTPLNNRGKKGKSFAGDVDKILRDQRTRAVEEHLKETENMYQKAFASTMLLEKSSLEIQKELCKEKNNSDIFVESPCFSLGVQSDDLTARSASVSIQTANALFSHAVSVNQSALHS